MKLINHIFRQKIIRFLTPGKFGVGFLFGVGFMLWLAIERKPIFDEYILFIIDLLNLTHS